MSAERFGCALKRHNVLMALAAARDLPQLNLVDALEFTILVAAQRATPAPAGRGAVAAPVQRAGSRGEALLRS